MNYRFLLSTLLILILLGCTTQQINTAAKVVEETLSGSSTGLSADEVAKGLKEALVQGTTKGTEKRQAHS